MLDVRQPDHVAFGGMLADSDRSLWLEVSVKAEGRYSLRF